MKTGRSLTELAQEIERQANAKRDFIADTRNLEMAETGSLILHNGENKAFPPTGHCQGQIAARLGIPKAYFDRMQQEAPQLLAKNVNHWFQAKPEPRMIRTLDGRARAFLSNRYRAIDNYDLAEPVIELAMEQPEMQVVSCEITETRMYLKFLFPRIQGEVQKGDIVQAGLVVSNSEIGAGSVRVEPLMYRLVCLNGMITNAAMRKYHIGRNQGDSDSIRELLSDRTKELADTAFFAEVRDVIRGSIKQDIFEGELDKFRQSLDMKITKDPVEVIELTRKKFQLSEDEKGGVLRHLIEGGSLTGFGLANAVTRHAQDVTDYDRATELERLGGQIIELSKNDWKALAA